MKKIIILTAIIMTTAVFSSISAQLPPPGGGDRDLRDTGVKGRSNELERIDRDARKSLNRKNDPSSQTLQTAQNQPEDRLTAKYDEIKADYEQIQKSQDSVVKAYQSAAQADYAQISKSSLEINQSAVRLNSNLFPPTNIEKAENKENKKSEKEIKLAKNVRTIIVELDNAIGSFVTSPMFQNLQVVDAQVSEKAQLDLKRIIELSELLSVEAQKMIGSGK